MSTNRFQPPDGGRRELVLRALLGPYIDVYRVAPETTAGLGRAATNEICLADEGVSRRHATLMSRGGIWFIVDEMSGAGTILNGVRITPTTPTPLGHGDLVRVGPWSFRVEVGDGTPEPALPTLDDTRDALRRVRRLERSSTGWASERFDLLSRCMGCMHEARDETELAKIALDHVLRGTGYRRGSVLCMAQEAGEVSIVAQHALGVAGAGGFSRSLIIEASKGFSAALAEASGAMANQSLAEMQVASALCVPVKLGEAVCAYLYLDAREGEAGVREEAVPFGEAIARAYGLALANLKRAELERRQAELTAELHAAREVQQVFTPPAQGEIGHVRFAIRVEPGVFVAGDLVDVFPNEGGVTVCFGDVAGHGAGSGMMMALTQSHLHASLAANADLVSAVESLNTYLCAHATEGRFVSLWLARMESNGRVRFVDAGHGHWLVRERDGRVRTVAAQGSIPVGIDPNVKYVEEEFALGAGDRVVVYSDGAVEQQKSDGESFGVQRLREAVAPRTLPEDDVAAVFRELALFAGRKVFDDDATVASFEYCG